MTITMAVATIAAIQHGGTGYYADLCPRCGDPFGDPAWMFPSSRIVPDLRICHRCAMDEDDRRDAMLPPLPVGDWALVREIECDSRAAGAPAVSFEHPIPGPPLEARDGTRQTLSETT